LGTRGLGDKGLGDGGLETGEDKEKVVELTDISVADCGLRLGTGIWRQETWRKETGDKKMMSFELTGFLRIAVAIGDGRRVMRGDSRGALSH
jgi:hypothetical protein